MVKLKLSGDGEYFQLAEILGGLNLNQKQFRQMCIAAGCDYKCERCWHTHSISFCKTFDWGFVGTIDKGGTEDYKNCFSKVETVFKHQTVFDLNTNSTVPLEKCEVDLPEDVQYLCGKYPYTIY
jgi:hypothetical protein